MLADADEETLRAIGLLYLVCTHGVDADLHEDERDLIVAKVSGRIVAATERRVYDAVRSAVIEYRQYGGRDAIARHVEQRSAWLAQRMQRSDLEQVVRDLEDMASADGAISDAERWFIDIVKHHFGLSGGHP